MRLTNVSLVKAALIAILLLPTAVQAEEFVLGNISSIKNEMKRLGDEAGEVASTPFDIESGGWWKTLAAVGATGLVYVFDEDIRKEVQDTKSKSLDDAAKGGSLLGNPFVHLGIAAAVHSGGVLAGSPKYAEIGLMMGEAALLADVSTLILKQGIGRARPYNGGDKGNFKPFQFESDYDSLPSMHTASSFAMASVIAGTSEKISVKVLSYASALFVGFSRIYEDKHWASDIILGAAVGELCGRVAMGAHVNKESTVRIVPVFTDNTISLAMLGHW